MADLDEDVPEDFAAKTHINIDGKDTRRPRADYHDLSIPLEMEHSGRLLDVIERLSCAELVPPPSEPLDIDDDYICKHCGRLVREPQMCKTCDAMYCQSCAVEVGQCKFGCEDPRLKPPPKLILKNYMNLQVKCKNAAHGCQVSGHVSKVFAHEDECPLRVATCENPLCGNPVPDRIQKYPDTCGCSQVCENIAKFAKDCTDHSIAAASFYSCLSEAKKAVDAQVLVQLKDQVRLIDEKKGAINIYREQKEELEAELKRRKEAHHIGKWDPRTQVWTCCSSEEKLSLGCKTL